jgi:ATP/maltotriose-dependent transcriptional regulator MalT
MKTKLEDSFSYDAFKFYSILPIFSSFLRLAVQAEPRPVANEIHLDACASVKP